jgi:hypothetical protein
LLDYAKNGGNLIVLYNTQEFAPEKYAPFPGQLTARAEEVSEEDSPVQILQPSHPVFNAPNRITKADFDGWAEQRGSKFWSEWDGVHPDDRDTRSRAGAAARRLVVGALWKRPLRVFRLRVPSPVAVRRARRLPSARERPLAVEDRALGTGPIRTLSPEC